MASAEGAALARKLGVRPGSTLALLAAPASLELELPSGVTLRRRAQGRADLVVAFATSRAELERRAPPLVSMIAPDGAVWLAWPKRSSGVSSDLADTVVREIGLGLGLVDNKVCAVDATWSALRFVVPVATRPSGR